MRHLVAIVACSTGFAVLPLAAQSSQCQGQVSGLRDACQKGTDIFSMLAPQVNGAIAGGGPTLGTARTSSGITIGLRLNVVDGRVPDLSGITLSSTGIVQSAIPTSRAPIPMPTVDAAFSVLPGFNFRAQRIMAVDVLTNVAYVPKRDLEDFSVGPTKGSFKVGYGVRVGVLADRLMVPAVSVSYFRRTLPTSRISASLPINASGSAQRDSITLDELSLRSDALRLAISKRFGFLELGGGAGQDRYRAFTQLRAQVTPVVLGAPIAPVRGAFVLTQQVSRNMAYGSLALNFGKVHLGAELGATFTGDSVATYNTFTDGKLNSQRLFGSAGLRVSF
ncbi:MAG: hypothetical protein V4813_08565 [Gemmatimonadota bacterium]